MLQVQVIKNMANGIQTFYLRDSKYWLELRKHFPHHHHFNFQGLNTTAFLPQLNYTSAVSSLTLWSIAVGFDGGIQSSTFLVWVPDGIGPKLAPWTWPPLSTPMTCANASSNRHRTPPSPASPYNCDPDANSSLIFA